MIDSWLPDRWPQDVIDSAKKFRQGHLLHWDLAAFGADFVHAVCTVTAQTGKSGDGYVRVDEAFPYVLITSQTCDICEEGKRRPRIPWVSVVPVYDILPHLAKGQDGHVRRNRIGYLVPLTYPTFVEDKSLWVADLRIEYPLEKSVLVARQPIEAFASESDYAFLADKLAFRRNRPAIDQQVRKFIIDPLGKALEEKAFRADAILEVRIRCAPRWDQVDRAQLFVIVTDVEHVEPVRQALERWQNSLVLSLPTHLALLETKVATYSDFRYEIARNTMLVDYSDLSA